MKRFKIVQTEEEIVSHCGLSLIDQAVKHYINFSKELDTQESLRHDIKHSEVMESYLALLSTGKNDF